MSEEIVNMTLNTSSEKQRQDLEREKQQLQFQKADFERAQDEMQAEKDEIEKQKLKLQKLEREIFKKDAEMRKQAETKELGTKGLIAAVNEATMALFQEDNKLKEKELTLVTREAELKEKEKQLKEDREKLRRTLIGRGTALQILKDLPPPMNIKGKNESYPIVRFSYKPHLHWYQGFINHYKDLCRVLRNIHSSGDISDELKLQIVSVFHYKNFPAKDFADLDIRVNRLVAMLKNIHAQFPHARLMELTRWFENYPHPDDQHVPPRPMTPIPITQIPEPQFVDDEDLAERSESNDDEIIEEAEEEEECEEQAIEDRILQEAREQFENEKEDEPFTKEMMDH